MLYGTREYGHIQLFRSLAESRFKLFQYLRARLGESLMLITLK